MVLAFTARLNLLGWDGLRVCSNLALSLHFLNEPDEFSQLLCRYDNTINIIVILLLIIIVAFML